MKIEREVSFVVLEPLSGRKIHELIGTEIVTAHNEERISLGKIVRVVQQETEEGIKVYLSLEAEV